MTPELEQMTDERIEVGSTYIFCDLINEDDEVNGTKVKVLGLVVGGGMWQVVGNDPESGEEFEGWAFAHELWA